MRQEEMDWGNIRMNRQEVYGKITRFWHDLDNSEYALYDCLKFSQAEIDEIREATNRIGKIFFKTAKLLRTASDDTLAQLDIPKKLFRFIRLQELPVESVIARVDLVKTNEGYKMFELNSDTPTFEMEVFHVNGVITKQFGVKDPNLGLEAELGQAVCKAVVEASINLKKKKPHIVFTSHGDHVEDRETTSYLMGISGLPAKYVPLEELQIIRGEGLYDEEGRKIDILYRQTYPLEHMIDDQDPKTKESVGEYLLELVAKNTMAIINPISAFLLQSKAVQAVIWGLMELNHPYFTKIEKSWIKAHFLPTYLEEDRFLTNGVAYVKKPSFGREGDTVEIFFGRKKILEDSHKTYQDSLPVYQQYVDLPSYTIKTTRGLRDGKILIGCFLVNGKASGIGIRAGHQITDNGAYFLPLGVKEEGGKKGEQDEF